MKTAKSSFKETNLVDLGTKKIYKYPFKTKLLSVAKIVVNGRHPTDKNKFILEHKCSFVIYVTKGGGKIYAGNKTFAVEEEDCVFVPTENKFAVEGNLEYVKVDGPAFYLEQSEEISID